MSIARLERKQKPKPRLQQCSQNSNSRYSAMQQCTLHCNLCVCVCVCFYSCCVHRKAREEAKAKVKAAAVLAEQQVQCHAAGNICDVTATLFSFNIDT